MSALRVYCDTSVFGGCFDEEFAEGSRRLFEQIEGGKFRLVLGDVTLRELQLAPLRVREILLNIPEEHLERVQSTPMIESLRDAFLSAGVVGPRSRIDAWHIATAAVAKVDLIVSWNFAHIVHFDKIKGYHDVCRRMGYPEIPIHSPLEVI